VDNDQPARNVSLMNVRVKSYSRYKASERPTRLSLGEQTLEIEEVADRWFTPGETYFRVRVSGGDWYVLRHLEGQDVWRLEAYTSAAIRTTKRPR
jgi:hypothetical protein